MKLFRVKYNGNDKSYMEDLFQLICKDEKVVVGKKINSHNMTVSKDYYIFHHEEWNIAFDVGCCIHKLVNSNYECCNRGIFSIKCCCK